MTTFTAQPDETAGLDSYVQDNAATTNYGTADNIRVGAREDSDELNRSFIKFDLSSLPENAIISSATLSLYALNDFSVNARTLRVYRLKVAFVETEVTYTIRSTGNDWAALGGFGAADCEQTDIGSRAFTATETLNEFKDIALTPTTKAGLDLGNGWLLKMDTEVKDNYFFASSDNATAANRPKLVIEYTLPAESSALFSGSGWGWTA